MHGGAILNQTFLAANLGRLETTDLLIVNCTSDLNILRKMFAGPGPLLCHLPLPVDPKFFRPLGRQASRRHLPVNRRIIWWVQPDCRKISTSSVPLAEFRRAGPALCFGYHWPILDDYPVLMPLEIIRYIAGLLEQQIWSGWAYFSVTEVRWLFSTAPWTS
jgi:hypothetical protein